MGDVKRCEHCDAKMVEYTHTLSKSLLRSFVIMVKHVEPARNFRFKDCDRLTYSQSSNMHKLKYWGLIKKKTTESGRGGDWLITDLAYDFLSGRVPIHRKVWTYRGEFKKFDGEPIMVDEVTGGWSYRNDYARTAVDHVTIDDGQGI